MDTPRTAADGPAANGAEDRRRAPAADSFDDRDQLIRHLTRNIPGGSINVFDRELRYLFAEGQGLARAGLSTEDLVGRTLSELFPPEAVDYVSRFYRRAFEGETLDFELEVGGRWFILSTAPLRGTQGQVDAIIVLAQEITERKETEEKLRRQLHLTKTITDRAGEGLFLMDGSGRVTFMNPAAEAMFGWKQEEMLGKVLHEVVHYRRADGTPFDVADCSLGRAMCSGEEVHAHEDTFYARDGRPVYVRCSNAPVFEGDRIAGAVLVVSDITASKEAEAERARLLDNEQRLRAEAEEANRLKDDFLATLSHELRTPLTAVLGWARLLGSGELDAQSAARAVEVIERNAEAQKQLIDDILDVSRIITGKLALESAPVEPAAVVAAAVESVRPAAQAKRITLNVLAHEETGLVSGDATRLRQVVWNLLTNAVKFTPEGGRVEVRVGREGSSARVVVSDTGSGIPSEFLPYVFDRFRQADATTTRKKGGLGLGLAIVRHLVELHGGTVSAESEGVGRGTTFTVTLPLADAPVQMGRAVEGARAPREERRPRGAGRPASLEGLRVLVVEDEPDAREFFASVLEKGGAEVLTAATADEALRLLRGRRPDVLVSDIGMPGEDGYALIRKVRQFGDGSRDIPAVALTAYARESDKEKAIGAGFQAHLTKPVEPDELREVVAGVAKRTEGTARS